jgi:hypothetical protein
LPPHDRRNRHTAQEATRESKRPRSVGTGVVCDALGGYSAVMVPFMSGWISQMNG